jgi:DNA polymerase-1
MKILLETDDRNIEHYYDTVTKDFHWRVPDIREAIRAELGYMILSADFSQIEIRIMAFLSQDLGLIAALNSGKDIHSYISTDIFGQKLNFDYELITEAKKDEKHPRHKELSELRSKTKTTVFGTPYGAGPDKIALMTGMSVEDAAEFIESYLNKYPKLKQWLKNQGDMALYNGYTQSIGGRKRFYDIPEIDHPEYNRWVSQIRRWASNQPIQASCADILKVAMALIYKKVRELKLSGRFKLTIHDEIVMQWLESEVAQGKQIMHDCMQEAYSKYISGIINPVDVQAGNIWLKG